MAENKYGVELISGITPKNKGTFPLVHAKDVEMPDGKRLSEVSLSGGNTEQAKCDLPQVTASDSGKILQVKNGKWEASSIAESSVKPYIDTYISSALGGDY